MDRVSDVVVAHNLMALTDSDAAISVIDLVMSDFLLTVDGGANWDHKQPGLSKWLHWRRGAAAKIREMRAKTIVRRQQWAGPCVCGYRVFQGTMLDYLRYAVGEPWCWERKKGQGRGAIRPSFRGVDSSLASSTVDIPGSRDMASTNRC